jgi:hypothetical protein
VVAAEPELVEDRNDAVFDSRSVAQIRARPVACAASSTARAASVA